MHALVGLGLVLVHILSCAPTPQLSYDCVKRCDRCEPSCRAKGGAFTSDRDQDCDDDCDVGNDWVCDVEADECVVAWF